MSHNHDGGAAICPTCGTDEREGEHRVTRWNEDGNGITVSCRLPRVSELPRIVHYLSAPIVGSQFWYRPSTAKSPAETMRAHLDTFGRGGTEEGR